MSKRSWNPFQKKESAPSLGPVTGCDLADFSALISPFCQDPFCRLRPPFSMEAARLSLELADMTYTLDLDPWKEAGWTDFSILIDDSLQSGLTHWESGEGLRAFVNKFRIMRAKVSLRDPNPVSQLLSALRQREKSDTVKAVCMMHPGENGTWLLAIGFMGTGKRFYDWISNFRFTTEEGFHRGFYQLCESFELNAESIVFPTAAQALGVEKLTLGEVFASMRSLRSPFRLWMAGHSQGSAVMQVLTHRLMTDWGVLPQNMVGYGFASPTVATGRFVYDPAAYPLHHILNSDDPVPRMGALLHLGMCAEYPSDDAIRQSTYGWSMDEEAVRLRDELAFFEEGMTDMPAVLMHMTALLQCMAEEKGADGLNDLLTSWWAIPAVDRVLWRAGDRAMDLVEKFNEHSQQGHIALTGRPLDEDALRALRERIRPIVKEHSARSLWQVLLEYGAAPHHLTLRDRQQDGAYAYILRQDAQRLRPFVWIKQSGRLPLRRYANWDPDGCTPRSALAVARRKRQPALPVHGKLRMSYSARRL